HYLASGGYESVAERFFARARVNHFLLEYDTVRAGDFQPLRFVPAGKGVVLGLVSSKTPVLESIDALKRRAEEASRYIDPDRLAIGPQCGFASTAAGNPLSEADERAKLRLVVEAARAIWGGGGGPAPGKNKGKRGGDPPRTLQKSETKRWVGGGKRGAQTAED